MSARARANGKNLLICSLCGLFVSHKRLVLTSRGGESAGQWEEFTYLQPVLSLREPQATRLNESWRRERGPMGRIHLFAARAVSLG